MTKKSLLKAKPEYLIRLAKWLKLDINGLRHSEIAYQIYFHILYN